MNRASRRPLRRLSGDRRGATVVEFALVVPVLLLLIMGLSELCYQLYVQSVLEGAVQKAARDSAIQGGADIASTIDQTVITMVRGVAPAATFNSEATRRQNYDDYARVGPEPFTDAPYNGTPADGVCDHGEPYSDLNGNGVWDASGAGATGQGGASDITKYTMTATYPRLFPVNWFGWAATAQASATTMLTNQPYATQTYAARGTGTGTCS